MTKAQKEEKARNERKLQQMLAAGIKVGPAEEGEEKKKKVVYENRKRGGKGPNKVSDAFLFLSSPSPDARVSAC